MPRPDWYLRFDRDVTNNGQDGRSLRFIVRIDDAQHRVVVGCPGTLLSPWLAQHEGWDELTAAMALSAHRVREKLGPEPPPAELHVLNPHPYLPKETAKALLDKKEIRLG